MISISSAGAGTSGPVFHKAPEAQGALEAALALVPAAVWPGLFALALLGLFVVVQPRRAGSR